MLGWSAVVEGRYVLASLRQEDFLVARFRISVLSKAPTGTGRSGSARVALGMRKVEAWERRAGEGVLFLEAASPHGRGGEVSGGKVEMDSSGRELLCHADRRWTTAGGFAVADQCEGELSSAGKRPIRWPGCKRRKTARPISMRSGCGQSFYYALDRQDSFRSALDPGMPSRVFLVSERVPVLRKRGRLTQKVGLSRSRRADVRCNIQASQH